MRRTLLVLAGVLFALVASELIVRAAVRVDSDGQRWLGERRVLPWRLPVSRIDGRLEALEDPRSLIIYDADLGWAPRPEARSEDGLVSIDQAGARSDGASKLSAAPSTRIVALGDSFTFGDEVADAESWPAQLESVLRERGRGAEVINLGVNGYGLDQAVLRFERDGVPLDADVVILGLQPENLLRSTNVLRPFYFPDTSLPLSKPRFVRAGDGFDVVNQPTLSLEALRDLLAAPGANDLLDHEVWFDERYRTSAWYQSWLLALAATLGDFVAKPPDQPYLSLETASVGDHVLDRLASVARASGARFIVVHLPRREEMESIRQGEAVWYGPWLEGLAARFEVLDPGFDGHAEGAFQRRGHYSPSQNARVARHLADHL